MLLEVTVDNVATFDDQECQEKLLAFFPNVTIPSATHSSSTNTSPTSSPYNIKRISSTSPTDFLEDKFTSDPKKLIKNRLKKEISRDNGRNLRETIDEYNSKDSHDIIDTSHHLIPLGLPTPFHMAVLKDINENDSFNYSSQSHQIITSTPKRYFFSKSLDFAEEKEEK
jgi:hypothetical protein